MIPAMHVVLVVAAIISAVTVGMPLLYMWTVWWWIKANQWLDKVQGQ